MENKTRESGILMPVSALPSRTGVGELGQQAYTFLELLQESGATIWQILPLNPVGYGNSPYQPYSSCAGDELYISLDTLYEEGYLKELPSSFREKEKRVDYEAVRAFKQPYLKEAYQTFQEKGGQETDEYRSFLSQKWVNEYAIFRALKARNGGKCWNEWETADRDWPQERKELPEEVLVEAGYQMFLQYLFYIQWMAVKKAANECGIRIMGDVPFYVGVDSVDVWAGRENFLLDTDGRPIFIAGVPPDYFSATGQRWGNPIYDWDYLKKQNYQFWVDRIGYSAKLFDIIRIDHFRAFDTFWKIPASCPTAVEGEWIEAPGYEVIDTLREKIPDVELVAEDLGDLRPEVLTLKEHYGLKGMKVFVFSIDTSGKYAYDSFGENENLIIYTGTHDNDTLMEWYNKLSCAGRRKVRRFLKKSGFGTGSVRDRLIACVFHSKAQIAILPMADILGLGAEGHINTPGTVGSPNWEWRMPEFDGARRELTRYRKLITERR